MYSANDVDVGTGCLSSRKPCPYKGLNPYTRLALNHQLLLLDPLRATWGHYQEIDGTADCFLAILKAEGLNRAANAKDGCVAALAGGGLVA